MKRYITEFIGTLFLVLAVGMTNGQNGAVIGSALMIMVYAGGHISGAHYNPAVTLAVFMRGRIKMKEAFMYVACQLLGALVAALFVSIFIRLPDTAPVQNLNIGKALLAELLGTFALAYVVLNVAFAKATAGNSYYGLAIGFTVLAMAGCLGGVSGGAFNPAVAIGASAMKMFEWVNIWIYLVACFAGGALAAYVFIMNNPDDL